MSPSLVDAAIYYYQRLGWSILPLHTPDANGVCSCGVRNCKSSGKHPRTLHGVHDASKSKAQILDWWREWPDANIGLAAGEASNVIVIDVDPRNHGSRSLSKLSAPPRQLVAGTGGGGRHYFVSYTDASLNHKPAEGIDIQGDNRIVVLAPSLHSSGARYKWLKKPAAKQTLGDLPDWALARSSNGTKRNDDKPSPHGTVLRNGRRNDGMTSIAGLWRRAGMEEAELRAALSVYNHKWCEPPLDDKEVGAIARSMVRYEPKLEPLSLTDAGIARRLLINHGDDLRYSRSLGWLEWNGKTWEVDASAHARYRISSIATVLREEAAYDKENHDKLEKAANICESARGISDIAKVAQDLPELSASQHEWDAQPWLFNVENGTIDLRETATRFKKHARDDHLTKLAPVTYNAKAKCPLFLRFMNETFSDDAETINYLQKLFGYCLTGFTTEQIFPVCWGTGANGKTTLLENVCGAVFGRQYRVQITAKTLLDSKYTGHPTELMDLRGARLAVASESGKRQTLDEEMIKTLTGGDRVKARRMHKDPEEFEATHKLFLITNNKPRTSNSDAIWRRLRLIAFTNMVPEEERDRALGAKLAAEAPGILNWMIDGCVKWQREQLASPPSVMLATSQQREDQDVLGMFFREAVLFNDKKRCTAASLYKAYQLWCADGGVRPLGKINFNRETSERFTFVSRKLSGGINKWYGLIPLINLR